MANYKSTNPRKIGYYVCDISDVATTSVHSGKTRLKKWIMIIIIIGERSEPLSRVFNDQPRDIYIWWCPYIHTFLIHMRVYA